MRIRNDFKPDFDGATVLVTGGAGFIGSHLTDALVSLDARVRVLDNLSDGYEADLDPVRGQIEFRSASITDPAAVDAAVKGCDYIFHLAANASVPRSSAEPAYDFAANVVGTFHVLDAVRRLGAPRLVTASSAAVYGEPLRDRMDEDHPLRPQSPYGGSKLAGEFLCESLSRCYRLDVRRVRIFNTYGPRQRRYVMFDLLEKLRKDPTTLEVIGTGQQERDYCYVSDTVAALLCVAAHRDAAGCVFNVAGGHPVTIHQLVEKLLGAVAIPRPLISYTGQSWRGDVARMVADTQRLQSFGWRPIVSLEAGLQDLVAWHKAVFDPPW